MAKSHKPHTKRRRMRGGNCSAAQFGVGAYGASTGAQLQAADQHGLLTAAPKYTGGSAVGLSNVIVPAGLLLANNYVRRSNRHPSRKFNRYSRRNKSFRRK